jgi:hypothetical protein
MTPKTAAKMMQECADLTRAETKANQFYSGDVAKRAALQAAGGLASDKTLRDEFAGQAMQGILSGMDLSTMPSYEEFGPFCYRLADAMLEARKTTGEGKA